MKKYAEGAVDFCFYDNLGSLILVKKSSKANAPKVMLSAHMDEVGFVVRKITKEGYLKTLTGRRLVGTRHARTGNACHKRWKARNTQGSLKSRAPRDAARRKE